MQVDRPPIFGDDDIGIFQIARIEEFLGGDVKRRRLKLRALENEAAELTPLAVGLRYRKNVEFRAANDAGY